MIVLCVPVIAILGWMERLGPVLGERQLVTDVGSTKNDDLRGGGEAVRGWGGRGSYRGTRWRGRNLAGRGWRRLGCLRSAMWLFTPVGEAGALEAEWRGWVAKFGARAMDMDARRHDQVCAWVSHLPQMVSTAMSAMFADEFAEVPELAAEAAAIGGRAFREMTRLGASPYSMWRDVAMTNTQPLAATLFALEQRLAHVRENLKTPELRDEFSKANAFRERKGR